MKRTGKVAAVGAIVMAMVLLGGCGLIAQKAVQSATGVKVDQSGGKTTVTGPNGQSATVSSDSGKVPDGLPDTVPVYSGKITGSAAVTTPQGNSYQFVVTTSDSISTVIDWYKTQLAAKGWTIDATVMTGEQGLVSGKNGTSQIAVTAGTDNGSTDVHTIVTVKQ